MISIGRCLCYNCKQNSKILFKPSFASVWEKINRKEYGGWLVGFMKFQLSLTYSIPKSILFFEQLYRFKYPITTITSK